MRLIASIILSLIIFLTANGQERLPDVFIETRTQNLEYFKGQYGEESDAYLKALIDYSCEFSQQQYPDCWKRVAEYSIPAFETVKSRYGVDSEEFRLFCVCLNGCLLGKNFEESDYERYRESVVSKLLTLKDLLKGADNNKIEFATILSGLYELYVSEPDLKQSLKYAKIKYSETLKRKPDDKEAIGYALTNLCCLYGQLGNSKEFERYLILCVESLPSSIRLTSLYVVANNMPSNVSSLMRQYLIDIIKKSGGMYYNENYIVPENMPLFWKRMAADGDIESLKKFENNFCLNLPPEKLYRFLSEAGITLTYDANKIVEAIDYELRAIDVAVSHGLENLLVRDSGTTLYQTVALLEEKTGDYTSTIDHNIKALELLGKIYGTESDVYKSQARYISALYNTLVKDPKKEMEYAQMAMESNSPDAIIKNLASMRELGQIKEAFELGIEALAKAPKESLGKLYNQLSMLFEENGDYEASLEMIDKAIDHSNDSHEAYRYKINRAGLLFTMNRSEEAKASLLSLLNDKSVQTESGKFHIFSGLGYHEKDKHKAIDYYHMAFNYLNSQSPDRKVRYFLNLGNAYGFKSTYSRINFDKAIAIYNQYQINDSILLGTLYGNLADYYSTNYDYQKADGLYFKAFECLKKLPPTNISLTCLLNNMAINMQSIGMIDESLRINILLRDIRLEMLPTGHPDLLLTLSNLFQNYLALGYLTEAEAVLEEYRSQSDSIQSVNVRERNITLMEARLFLGKLEFSEAEKSFIKAYELSEDSESRCAIAGDIADMYRFHDSSKGIKYAVRHIDLARADMIQRLPYLSSTERESWLFLLSNYQNWLIDYAKTEPDLLTTAFDFALFRKGLLFHTTNEVVRLLGKQKGSVEKLRELDGLKNRRNDAMSRGDSISVANMNEQIQSAERGLSVEFLVLDKLAKRLDLSSRNVLSNLPSNALGIDFISYRDSAMTNYAAFVISKDSKMPVWVPLFEESEIKEGLGTSDNLFNLIWKPLLPHFQGHQEVYFSTDGLLNILPIEFAEGSDGIPLCQKFVLHRVFHLADLKPSSGIGNNVEIIGVADHNSPNGEARGLEDGFRGNWNDLAGVEAELYRVAESLEGVSNYHRVFNDMATEEYVKDLSGKDISTLHISTHGFYRNNEDLIKALNDSTDFDHNMAKRVLMGNRNSISGLIMRNGNLSWKADSITDEEDNILTSEEVETLSFPNLKLTVLSACETGLGELSADGVSGLQRAFRIAGSSYLICSLRQVKDNGTADFMSEFYRQAASGQNIHDAFYRARRELLERDPDKKEVWSSFILIE